MGAKCESHRCPVCGSEMSKFGDTWVCTVCDPGDDNETTRERPFDDNYSHQVPYLWDARKPVTPLPVEGSVHVRPNKRS